MLKDQYIQYHFARKISIHPPRSGICAPKKALIRHRDIHSQRSSTVPSSILLKKKITQFIKSSFLGCWGSKSPPLAMARQVDCGTCLCVPQSSCQYCPGAWSGGSGGSGGGSSTPRPTPEIVARPSTVPLACEVVRNAAMRWSNAVKVHGKTESHDGILLLHIQRGSILIWLGEVYKWCHVMSEVPYCPASYVDCGTCLCVPYATCQWCPGVANAWYWYHLVPMFNQCSAISVPRLYMKNVRAFPPKRHVIDMRKCCRSLFLHASASWPCLACSSATIAWTHQQQTIGGNRLPCKLCHWFA